MCICCRLFMHAVKVHRAAANVCTSSVDATCWHRNVHVYTLTPSVSSVLISSLPMSGSSYGSLMGEQVWWYNPATTVLLWSTSIPNVPLCIKAVNITPFIIEHHML